MRTMRQDAWTAEDDRVLADILLRHIRQGSTQLAAFDEAASVLGRTAAACGYRWNAVVRAFHKEAIAEAKLDRKNLAARYRADSANTGSKSAAKNQAWKTVHFQATDAGSENRPSWLQILNVLRIYKKQYEDLVTRLNEYEEQAHQKDHVSIHLQSEVAELKEKLNVLQEEYESVKKEYHALLSIFDRARRISEETVS